jgi:putative DNA primase/helicase
MGIAEDVAARAKSLEVVAAPVEYDEQFIRACLDANERGDGVLYSAINGGQYLYNTTPKDGEWLCWGGVVWEKDDFRSAFGAVENVALEYEALAERYEIESKGIDKTDPEFWKVNQAKKYRSRVDRLRTENGAKKALVWAPVVSTSMACKESDLDRQPWLLPCTNGVIDLKTGVLLPGRPSDLLTRSLDLAYDLQADYTAWSEFITEVSGSEDVASFLKRFFGYSVTGLSFEQYIAVFIGGGRNGKGVLFSCLASVLGPFYHVISPGMITEQKIDPTPNAASEHKYALMGKRLVVAGESKRGQRVDPGQLKGLTGDDAIECRPNFGKVVVFNPTHTLCLHTNHMPVGMGSEFSLLQRLLKIDFPWAYVDDPESESRKNPKMAAVFKKKDRNLKDRLMENKAGILRWLVEGCLEWQAGGLAPPLSIQASVDEMARSADYIGLFCEDCLEPETIPNSFVYFSLVYAAFYWWWDLNRGDTKNCPKKPTLSRELRDRGIDVRKEGDIKIYGHRLHSNLKISEIEAVAEKLYRRS